MIQRLNGRPNAITSRAVCPADAQYDSASPSSRKGAAEFALIGFGWLKSLLRYQPFHGAARQHTVRRACAAESLEVRALLAANPIGNQFIVNETTALTESPAVVAVVEGTGDFVAAWTSFEQNGGDTSGLGVYAQQFNSDNSPKGAAFLVNTGYTDGDQGAPDIAVDTDGNFVVVWESPGEDGDGFGIYGQRYLASGAADGMAFRVNEVTTGDQQRPSVAADNSGRFVVAWQSDGQDGDGIGVYARKYNHLGTPLDATEFLVNTTTDGNQAVPDVAVARSNGNFVIAWEGEVAAAETSVEIQAKVYNSAGVVIREEFQVNNSIPRDQVSADVAMDADGDFIVAWTSEGQTGSGSDIYARRFTSAGAYAGTEFRVNETTLQGQVNPAVGTDANGDFIITWQTSHQDEFSWGIYGRIYQSNGQVLTTEFQVNTFAEQPQINPGIAVNSDGQAIVVWQGLDDTHSPAVHVQQYQLPAPGQAFSPVGGEVVLNNYMALEETSASAAVDASRNFVVVWQSYSDDGSGLGILARQFDSGGTPLGDAFIVNTTTADNQSNPGVAVDAAGNFTVIWESADQDGDGHGIFGQQFNSAGVKVGAEFAVNSTVAGSQEQPAISMNQNDGSFIVVWQGPDADARGIYGQRFDANANPVGDEFAINSFESTEQVSPAVSMNTAGQFVVGWVSDHRSDFDPEDSEKSIFVQWYNASGVATGPEQLAHSINPAAEAQEYPSLAIDENGDFVAVWQSITQDGSAWGVYGRQFLADKTAVQPVEFLVNQKTDENQRQAGVASDADGNFTVVWQSDLQDQSATAVMSRQFNSDGTPETDETLVNTWELGPQTLPVIAMTPAGDFGTFWTGQGNGRVEGIHGRINVEGYVVPPPHITVDPIGFQFLVADAGGQETSTPSVAVIEGSGDYIATWASFEQADEDESGLGVYAQRFHMDGTPNGNLQLVNTAYTHDDQTSSVVAVDASGNFVIVWQSLGQDGDGAGIYAQRYNNTDTPVGTAFRVNNFTDGDQSSPSVAMDNAGNFIISWQSFGQDGDGLGVYARRYNAAGTPQESAEFRVNTQTDGNQFAPAVARDRSGDQFVVTWQAEIPTLVEEDVELAVEIMATLYHSDGVAFNSDLQVNSLIDKDQVLPAVAMANDGSFVVSWTTEGGVGSGADVFARRFNAMGIGVSDDFQVNVTTGQGQQNPAVAIDDNGDFIITWESSHQDGFSWGIFGQVYASNGAVIAEEFQVNTNTQGPQIRPAANANTAGDAVVLWLGLDATHHAAVHAQRFQLPQPTEAYSVGAEGEVVLANYSALEESPASVAVDANRNFVSVWQSYGEDGSGLGIFGQRLDPNGNPVGGRFLITNTTDGNQSQPDVAMDYDGNFTVVWQSAEQDGSGYGVFARQFAADSTPIAAEFQVNSATTGNQGAPSIAMNPVSGAITVVWQGPDAQGTGIFSQRFNADGSPLGAESQVNHFSDLDQFSPRITMNGAGQSVVTWVSDHRAVFDPTDTEKTIFAQWFDADQTTNGFEFPVHSIQPEYEAQEFPDVAMAPDGSFVVAFQSINQDGNTWGVFARQFLPDKAGVQPIEFQVNQTIMAPQRHASVVVDELGNFVVAWQSHAQDSGGPGVFARVYDAAAVAQTDEFIVPTWDQGPQTYPVMAMTQDGDFGVFWTGHGVDRVEGVQGRIFETSPRIHVSLTGPATGIMEGDAAEFTLSLSEPAVSPITVVLSLNDGTAMLGKGDFAPIAAPGVFPAVSFAPGESTKTVIVATNIDGITEPDETFSLSLVSVFGSATINGPQDTAVVTIEGADLQIAPIADQTIAANAGIINLHVASSSSEETPAVLTTGSLPAFVSFTDNGDGTGVFTFGPESGDIGTAALTLIATDSNGTAMEDFLLNIVAADTSEVDTSIRRINAGGGAVGDFQADAFFNTGRLYTTTATIDMTQVPGVPMQLFQSTRWDAPTDGELQYSIPVDPGQYEVRLYFAEIYSRVFNVGGRVFDVSLEGTLVLDNFDVFVAAGGGNRAIVKSFMVNSDANLNIDFGHVVENPDIMGIEIIRHTTITNEGPVISSVPPVAVASDASSTVAITASDADGDPITLTAFGLPSFASLIDHGDGTGAVVLDPTAMDAGEYAVTVQATSGSQLLTDSTSFSIQVTRTPGPPGTPDWPVDGSVANGGTVTATTGLRIDGPVDPVAEGELAVFTISLPAPAVSAVSVLLELQDGTATRATGDYAPLAFDGFETAVLFAPGEQSKQVSVRANTDTVNEIDETFSLTLIDAFGATIEAGYSSATATISGAVLSIGPTPDQTIAAGTGPVNLVVAANNTDGNPSALTAISLPTWATFTDNGNGTATITMNPANADIGMATISFSATDSNTSVTAELDVTVVAADITMNNESIFRINSGDGAVGTFTADQYANVGALYSTSSVIDVSDPSIPAGTPAAVFQTTRWDAPSGAELSYDIPVTPGDYEVRLYFAEIYSRVFRVGGRVFDVAIEGQNVLDNLDVFAEVGANKGIVKTFEVTTLDGKIDVDFGHVIENPNIMGIEIIDRNQVVNTGPVLSHIPPQSVTVGSVIGIPVTAIDANATDMIVLSTPDLPAFATFTDNGNGTGLISLSPVSSDVGGYPISVQATSGDQSLTDLEGFLLAVDDLLSL